MNEYIDFEVARKYLHEACAGLGSNGGLMLKIKFDQEPTADVVEVVRCESCKYSEHCAKAIRKHGIEKAINYCSYGERREDAN